MFRAGARGGGELKGGRGILFTVFLSLVKIISLFVNLKEFQATGQAGGRKRDRQRQVERPQDKQVGERETDRDR